MVHLNPSVVYTCDYKPLTELERYTNIIKFYTANLSINFYCGTVLMSYKHLAKEMTTGNDRQETSILKLFKCRP